MVEGAEEELATEDLLIEAAQKEGYVSDSDHGITVVLDTNLTEALIEEGFVRELISKVQTMRKDSDFNVMDRIAVSIVGSDKIRAILEKDSSDFKSAVLCDTLTFESGLDGIAKEWSINGEAVTITIKR